MYVPSVIASVPTSFHVRLENLTMRPSDWAALNAEVEDYIYRAVVNEYQHMDWERLPRCSDIFCLCRHYDCGRCTSKHFCECKKF